MSSHSLAVMELEMPSWTVVSLNEAAKILLGDTPWGSSEGQCLSNSIVHFHDMPILENMWLEAQSVSNGPSARAYAPPSEVPPLADSPSTKTIRFSRYHLHNTFPTFPSTKERNKEVFSEAYVPTESTSVGGPSAGCFPHPFGPDPLFEDGGVTEEFREAAGATDGAWNKTKEDGRKSISCSYVAAHVQVP